MPNASLYRVDLSASMRMEVECQYDDENNVTLYRRNGRMAHFVSEDDPWALEDVLGRRHAANGSLVFRSIDELFGAFGATPQ